jgi:hypothetical protein
LQRATEDLDRPPSFEINSGPAYTPPIEDRPASPQTENFVSSAASTQEPSRRRSTIREPAPFAGEGTTTTSSPASAPTPVISSTSSEEPAAPKRGWWGKRLLGDKG